MKMKLLLTALLSLTCLSAVANNTLYEKPEYDTMGAKEFYTKHCKRACVEAMIAMRYRADSVDCTISEDAYKANPEKYKWLSTFGFWGVGEFKFSHQSTVFINWQASQVLVTMDSGEDDFMGLLGIANLVALKSTREVKRQCEAVGGTFS